MPNSPKMSSYLACPSRSPSEPEHEEDEQRPPATPGSTGRNRSGKHSKGGDHEPDHQTRRPRRPSRPLDVAGAPPPGPRTASSVSRPKTPPQDVAGGRAQEDVQDALGPPVVAGGVGPELIPDGPEHGDEDQPDALDEAPAQRCLRARRRPSCAFLSGQARRTVPSAVSVIGRKRERPGTLGKAVRWTGSETVRPGRPRPSPRARRRGPRRSCASASSSDFPSRRTARRSGSAGPS